MTNSKEHSNRDQVAGLIEEIVNDFFAEKNAPIEDPVTCAEKSGHERGAQAAHDDVEIGQVQIPSDDDLENVEKMEALAKACDFSSYLNKPIDNSLPSSLSPMGIAYYLLDKSTDVGNASPLEEDKYQAAFAKYEESYIEGYAEVARGEFDKQLNARFEENAAEEQLPKVESIDAQLAREQEARDQEARDQAARDQAARDQEARDQEARDQEARDQAAREQEAREQEAREQEDREQEARAAWENRW